MTKRGKAVVGVRRVHERISKGLGLVVGWLENRDPFFDAIAKIEQRRHTRVLRVVGRIGA